MKKKKKLNEEKRTANFWLWLVCIILLNYTVKYSQILIRFIIWLNVGRELFLSKLFVEFASLTHTF